MDEIDWSQNITVFKSGGQTSDFALSVLEHKQMLMHSTSAKK